MTRLQSFLERLPLAPDRPVIGYGVTLLLVFDAFLGRIYAQDILPPGLPFVTFFPAVAISAFLFGTRAGIVAAIICGLAAWYYFIPPGQAFAVNTASVAAMSLYLFVVCVEVGLIHLLQSANRVLGIERSRSAELSRRSAILFDELQHRVSNNLQVAAALLTLQKRDTSDADARTALDDGVRRLALIGRISRKLYDPTGAATSMSEFLPALYADVIAASGGKAVTGSIRIDPTILIDQRAMVPIALIFAESIANAIEHGIGDRDGGAIDVTLRHAGEDQVELLVADDGAGLPAGFTLDGAASLGLKIARTLAQQLRGSFSLESADGTTARLILPA